MKALEIINAGLQASVQDHGRWGFQEYGVPVCGSVAPYWRILANHLVGNEAEAAGIEFRLMGPTLKAVGEPLKIAVCGQVTSELVMKNASGLTTHKIQPWRSFTLKPDQELKIGSLEGSATGFIAVLGGVETPTIMKSRSTYARSQIGNWLEGGDLLPVGAGEMAEQADCVLPSPPIMPASPRVRIVWGPQDDYFDPSEKEKFLNAPYVISKASDRMGARLDGAGLKHKADKGAEIASDGVVLGAIQVPGNGQPIVLLNDGQTVGGYPKIATVISSDLHLIANGLAGMEISFELVTVREACDIARAESQKIEQMKRSIVKASANGFVDLSALYESNLIGGVVDMKDPRV
ncbi:putative Allophanate hydrolase, subunit 2 [Candidatus Terasakiella magnetica]|uniref:Putative Allophanate hydrolase, subunit 2 n=1 Tax=Candidatus Terasakiella magnetica TaxID=1867952 RepID=A0A1C3RI12_9PROT|nr:biotin-dependent carboxyltransferase family protein [Candidatus Terasakiella magnetica]SCA56852.1 putative Allophanate hydrolase, subunit 2 [Candidatus Terasakiella magnetica]